MHSQCVLFSDRRPCSSSNIISIIRHASLNVFISILRNYSQFTIPNDVAFSGNEESPAGNLVSMIKVDAFLSDLDLESRAFMNTFVHTQSFYEFIAERLSRDTVNYETLFFDESVKAKLNRSRFQFNKQSTSFLVDRSFDIGSTVFLSGPNESALDDGNFQMVSNLHFGFHLEYYSK